MSATVADVRAAAEALDGVAHRTPVLTSRILDGRTGSRMFLKAENLQRSGAFKFRGAFTALRQLPPGRGVVAYSAGNHAQAIALAAQLQGRRATAIMPEDTPSAKLDATRGCGAEVITYDRLTQDREEIAARISAELGASVIPPYDDPTIIAGQGTAARELFEDVGPLDLLFVPLGGGGLLSGTLLAAAELSPGCRIVGVEPESGAHGKRSLESGEQVEIPVPVTIADGVRTTRLGDLTYPIIREHVSAIVSVSDEQLIEQMRYLAGYLKIVVEPTGALGLAAARDHARFLPTGSLVESPEARRVGVILSGGNVDLGRFAELVG